MIILNHEFVKSNMKFVPNIISLFRVFVIPFIVFFFLKGGPYILLSMLFFVAAIFSDFYDGRIARKYDVVSRFGTFIDPLADKILVLTCFLLFYFHNFVPLWVVVLIFARDFFITILRVHFERNGKTLKTSRLGKYKTALQYFAIFVLFMNYLVSPDLMLVTNFIVYFVAMATLFSGVLYLAK